MPEAVDEALTRALSRTPVDRFPTAAEFAVALRSAVVRGERAWLFAGNGIMGDSSPQSEFAEVQLKFRPVAEALGA